MKLVDIGAMALHNLRQRRMRTAMNLVGVVIGCIVLLMTSAGAAGVKNAFQSLFDASEFARQIEVYSAWSNNNEPPEGEIVVEGDMVEERRKRIRERLVQAWKQEHFESSRFVMTSETIEEFESMNHVLAVVPHSYTHCSAWLSAGEPLNRTEKVSSQSGMPPFEFNTDGIESGLAAAGPPSSSMKQSILAGGMLEENDTNGILVHEFLAYRLGFRSDAELPNIVGRQLTLEWKVVGRVASLFNVLSEQMQEMTSEYMTQQLQFVAAFKQLFSELDKTSLSDEQKEMLRGLMADQISLRRDRDDIYVQRTFTVRGVHRAGASETLSRVFYQHLMGERIDLQVHRDVATELKLISPDEQEFHNMVVIVDSTKHLREVTDKLKETGVNLYSSLAIIESINNQIDRNSWVVYGVASAILLTAAIGISNTLIISVMERTPEFGIMKALGARDKDLVALMLCEGAVLGFVGAVSAVGLSWILSFVVQIILRTYIENQVGGDITGALFHFSLMPILATFGISMLVCSIASIAPAFRAARLDPVVAMQRT